MIMRDSDRVNHTLNEWEQSIQDTYVEYHSDDWIRIDGSYTLEELKQIIAIIEGVPPQ